MVHLEVKVMNDSSFEEFEDYPELLTQGTKVNYYVVCKRKLWFYSKGITMEQNSDAVLIGKIFHEDWNGKRGKVADIEVDGLIKIDIIDGEKVYELKSTKSMKEASRTQLLYYLYVLKLKGIHKTGVLVTKNTREKVELTNGDELKLLEILREIKMIEKQSRPPREQKSSKCRNCSYHDLCFGRDET
jgi:CRISPR-associated exonuclease Cas4